MKIKMQRIRTGEGERRVQAGRTTKHSSIVTRKMMSQEPTPGRTDPMYLHSNKLVYFSYNSIKLFFKFCEKKTFNSILTSHH